MKTLFTVLTVLLLSVLIVGCKNGPGEPIPAATISPAPEMPAHTPEVALPNEKIMILEPAPGSRVISPVLVSGVSDSTFEQTLVIRLLLEDGSVIAQEPVMIRSELGQRGPFELELYFDARGEQQAFIQVVEHSARDGEITHLSTVGVTVSETGPADVRRRDPQPEQIIIFQPAIRERVQGGTAVVTGYGWASFEQTLLVEVQDQDGRVVGSTPVLVDSSEMGQPGQFSAQVPYQVDREGPGRILVRDISPAFGGDVHRVSVEIDLAP